MATTNMTLKILLIASALTVAAATAACTPGQSGFAGQSCGLNNQLMGSIADNVIARIFNTNSLNLFTQVGQQQDEQCRQMAVAVAMRMASTQPQQGRGAHFQSVEYTTPSNNRRHRLQPVRTYTNRSTKQVCNEYTDTDEATGAVSKKRACKGPDGEFHDA
jgi:hypothetical protein